MGGPFIPFMGIIGGMEVLGWVLALVFVVVVVVVGSFVFSYLRLRFVFLCFVFLEEKRNE